MDFKNNRLIQEMISYNAGDAKRIQHFLKVYSFAKLIGQEEKLDEKEQEILETAAIVHDIGIKQAEKKYHSSAGKYQEELGPDEARRMLKALSYPEDLIERVCFLVGHHHTYDHIQGRDYQILVEADFLVNLYEDGCGRDACQTALTRVFRTETGCRLLRTMFLKE